MPDCRRAGAADSGTGKCGADVPRILADRQQFIDCYHGNLLTVDDRGVITQLGDCASAAFKAAERGERVWLTVRGVIVSYFENGQEVRT